MKISFLKWSKIFLNQIIRIKLYTKKNKLLSILNLFSYVEFFKKHIFISNLVKALINANINKFINLKSKKLQYFNSTNIYT